MQCVEPQEVNGSITSEACDQKPNKFAMLFKSMKNGKKPKHLTISMPVRIDMRFLKA